LPYPTVTQVLSPWIDFSHVHPDVLEIAADRGTAVHRYCAAIAQDLWLPEPPEEIAGYIQSFRQWFKLVKKVVLVETELVDDINGYIGHPDLIVEIQGMDGLCLIDLKTSENLSPVWRLQLAAYWNLCWLYEIKVKHVGVLRLNSGGKVPKMDWFKEVKADLAVFFSALNVWKFLHG